MKVKVLRGPWQDHKENKQRKVGDEFICSKERFEEIKERLAAGAKKRGLPEGEWVEEVDRKK